jgi:predicted AAA+ superfamily ATPase
MKFVQRRLEAELVAAMKAFPAVVLTGPRRVGKTWLLKHLFPKADYVLLEDPDIVSRVRSDPQGFLDGVRLPVILDEVQQVPELFSYIRSRIDRASKKKGQWILTGSQESPLMQGVTESMAGRAAILQLFPLSCLEHQNVSVLDGGFPEVLARPKDARRWFSSYLQTYLERDVRTVTAVKDLATFRRFMALVASRHGQLLNKTDLAAPLGVSVPTIAQWLGVLEVTGQILLVPPFYENLGKRLTKSPKLYVLDSGLACHLLGIETRQTLVSSPFYGALFEGFVAAEIVKEQINSGRRKELYFFRDEQGLEVDFLVPCPGGHLAMVECKAGQSVFPEMARPMERLMQAFTTKRPAGTRVDRYIVYQPSKTQMKMHALSPMVQAVSVGELIKIFVES